MRGKTLMEWLNLSASLYLISRDEDLKSKIVNLKDKVKQQMEAAQDQDGRGFYKKIYERISEIEEKSFASFDSMLTRVYKKIRLAHVSQVDHLEVQIKEIRRELALLEAKLVAQERNHRNH